jgi:hypothetical protein
VDVQIDHPRTDELARAVDRLRGVGAAEVGAHCGDAAAGEGDVRVAARALRRIQQRPPGEQQVVPGRHR